MDDTVKPPTSASSRSLDIHRLSQHLAIMSLAAELAEIAIRRNDGGEALSRIGVVLEELQRLREWAGALKATQDRQVFGPTF
jgi:hypothetical protein